MWRILSPDKTSSQLYFWRWEMEKNNKVKGEGREDGKNKNKYYAYNFLCGVIKQIEAFLYTTHRYSHTEIKS